MVVFGPCLMSPLFNPRTVNIGHLCSTTPEGATLHLRVRHPFTHELQDWTSCIVSDVVFRYVAPCFGYQ